MHLGEGAIMAANCDEAMPPVGALFKAQQPFTKLLVPLVHILTTKIEGVYGGFLHKQGSSHKGHIFGLQMTMEEGACMGVWFHGTRTEFDQLFSHMICRQKQRW